MTRMGDKVEKAEGDREDHREVAMIKVTDNVR